jgi:hypothetical protein
MYINKDINNYSLKDIDILSRAIELNKKINNIKEEIKPETYFITKGEKPYLIYCDLNNYRKINFLNICDNKIEKTIETNFQLDTDKCANALSWIEEATPTKTDYIIISIEFFPDKNNDINSGYLLLKVNLWARVYLKEKEKENKDNYKEDEYICEFFLNLKNNSYIYKYLYGIYKNNPNKPNYYDRWNFIEFRWEYKIYVEETNKITKIFYYRNNPYLLTFYPLYIIDITNFQIISINHIKLLDFKDKYKNLKDQIDLENYNFRCLRLTKTIFKKKYYRFFKDEKGYTYLIYFTFIDFNLAIVKYINLITGKEKIINESIYINEDDIDKFSFEKINILKYKNKNYLIIYGNIGESLYKVVDFNSGNILKELNYSEFYNDYLTQKHFFFYNHDSLLFIYHEKVNSEIFYEKFSEIFFLFNLNDCEINELFKIIPYINNNSVDKIVLECDKNINIITLFSNYLKHLDEKKKIEEEKKRIKKEKKRNKKKKKKFKKIYKKKKKKKKENIKRKKDHIIRKNYDITIKLFNIIIYFLNAFIFIYLFNYYY